MEICILDSKSDDGVGNFEHGMDGVGMSEPSRTQGFEIQGWCRNFQAT